jgi:hypothetical protein
MHVPGIRAGCDEIIYEEIGILRRPKKKTNTTKWCDFCEPPS